MKALEIALVIKTIYNSNPTNFKIELLDKGDCSNYNTFFAHPIDRNNLDVTEINKLLEGYFSIPNNFTNGIHLVIHDPDAISGRF